MKPTKKQIPLPGVPTYKDAICHQGGGNPLLEIQRG